MGADGLAERLNARLARGRAMAEARMVDTFEIGMPTGEREYDPAEQADIDVVEPLFTTKGRVKASRGQAAREAQVGGRTAVSVSRELHIPVDSPAVPTGAVAVCTAVHWTTDPTLLGARLRLSGPAPGSATTARRLQVEEQLT